MSKNTQTPQDPKVWVAGEELQKWITADLTAYVGRLEGKWLTLIDATFSDSEQRKAMKDVVRQMIWNWDIEIIERFVPDRKNMVLPDGRPSMG